MTVTATRLGRIFTLGLGAWLCCACTKKDGPAAEAKAGDPADARAQAKGEAAGGEAAGGEAAKKTGGEPGAPADSPSGVAYLAVDRVGVHILDDQGWRLHHGLRSDIADMLELDGQLHLLSPFGVQRIGADKKATTLAEFGREDFARLGALAALGSARGRELWVAGREGVGHFEGGSWAITPLAEIGGQAAEQLPVDVALDHARTPWLIHAGVFVHREGRWASVDAPPGVASSPLAAAADAATKTVVIHAGCDSEGRRCALLRERGGELTRYELDAGGCAQLEHLALSPNAELAAIAGRCGVIRVHLDEPGGAPTRVGLDAGWHGQPVRSLAIDDGGRVWAGTNSGLTLVGAGDLGEVESYPLAALGDIAAPLGAIVLTGEGPPPPTLGRVRHGGLSATIVTVEEDRKQPLAGVAVELCSELPPPGSGAADPSRSPCAKVEPVHATTTDAQGRFSVDNLEIAHYYIGVELDGRWALATPKAMSMRAGMKGNIGSVIVAPPE